MARSPAERTTGPPPGESIGRPHTTGVGHEPTGPTDRGDFHDLLSLLPTERTLLADLRRYLESDVAPLITDH